MVSESVLFRPATWLSGIWPKLPLSALAVLACTGVGLAQQEIKGQSETTDRPNASAPTSPSVSSSLGPFADPGGVRATLGTYGVHYSLTYIGEQLGNVSGGVRRGSIYEGRLDLSVDADLEKLLGWSAGAFHATGFQIHGEGLTRKYVQSLYTTSGIEALPSTRLYDIYFEQRLGSGLDQHQKAMTVARATADAKLAASLS